MSSPKRLYTQSGGSVRLLIFWSCLANSLMGLVIISAGGGGGSFPQGKHNWGSGTVETVPRPRLLWKLFCFQIESKIYADKKAKMNVAQPNARFS
jgi:hypothetical protein